MAYRILNPQTTQASPGYDSQQVAARQIRLAPEIRGVGKAVGAGLDPPVATLRDLRQSARHRRKSAED